MEGSVARSLGRLERLLKAHECVSCVQSDLICRDLAIVLWNTVAFEIVYTAGLGNLKCEMLGGFCEVMSRKGALDVTEVDHLETCNLIKEIARKSIHSYFIECSRLIQGVVEGGKDVKHPRFVLMQKVYHNLDLFFSSECTKGMEYFVEPMVCPLARFFLERYWCSLELRTSTLVFQYIVRHMGKSARQYSTVLRTFILRVIRLDNYKDEMFRLLYPHVVDLLGTIVEFGKEVFQEELLCRKSSEANIFQTCMLHLDTTWIHEPHLDSKLYGRMKLYKFAYKETCSAEFVSIRPSYRDIQDLMEPLTFGTYEKLTFVYDTFLELLETHYTKDYYGTRSEFRAEMIWHAFCGYFRQRKQKGDEYKSRKFRLIAVLGGADYIQELKIRCKTYKPAYWIRPFSILYRKLKPSTADASTQVDYNDFPIS